METQSIRETPIATLNVGQLFEALEEEGYIRKDRAEAPSEAKAPERRYVYGIKGIMELFGVSNVTAQRYKAGVIKDAVRQYGRKIVTDADLALELFNASRGS